MTPTFATPTLPGGFAIYPEVLPPTACDDVAKSLSSRRATAGRAGTRHLMSESGVAAIASDSRLLQIAEEILGGSAVPYRATLFEKTEQANWLIAWHQDTALPLKTRFEADGWGPWSQKQGVTYTHAPAWALERVVALRLHLDDSHADNGPLRVIPNSHTSGVLSDESIHEIASQQASEECLVSRGGVIAMRPLLIHCSGKILNHQPRRVLHIEYADTLTLAGIEMAIS